MGLISVKILLLSTGLYSDTDAVRTTNKKTVILDEARGVIYDCNGEPLTGTQAEYFAVIPPSEKLLYPLKKALSPEQFADVQKNFEKGRLTIINLNDKIINVEGVYVFPVNKRYCENQPAAHVIGYLKGEDDRGVAGIEKSFDELLYSENKLQVSFSVDAQGRALIGEKPYVTKEEYNVKQGVQLTLDKSIQQIAECALDSSSVKRGAAVVLDIETGEIRAMVSRPVFSPENPAASLNLPGSPFVNRALTSYAVGSVFKPVVAAAALESGITPDLSYNCTGAIKNGNTVFHCHKTDGHGKLNMQEALAVSCNPYFINLSTKLNPEEALEKSLLLGLGQKNILAPGIEDSQGVLPKLNEIKSPAAFANFSFGQGNFTATPLQIAAAYGAIANNGEYLKPTLVKATVDANGAVSAPKPMRSSVAMQKNTADMLAEFLKNTVETGSGKRAKPDKTTAAGKTATAQSGQYKNGAEILHTWFAGFFPADSPKYSVVVFNEEGLSGAVDCAPVFKAIADGIISSYS